MNDDNKITMAIIVSIAVFACTTVVRISGCVATAPATVNAPENVQEMEACAKLCGGARKTFVAGYRINGPLGSEPKITPMQCLCGQGDGGL